MKSKLIKIRSKNLLEQLNKVSRAANDWQEPSQLYVLRWRESTY